MDGKYKAYPEYRDSGVEWLREIPNHWSSTAIKKGYDIALGKMLQKTKKNAGDQYRPYLKAANIQPSGISADDTAYMWFSPQDRASLLLKAGDLLVSEGGDVGRSAIWRCELPECYIQNAINRVRAKKENSTSFLYYWMQMLKASDFISTLCNKATIAHYTAEKLSNSLLFLTPLPEQIQITRFLDHETGKIDLLIQKQQELIALLKEKRQAVISHAVTKGLNPQASLKDSGIEWLGQVPEHWEVKRFKFTITEGASGPYGSSLTKSMYTSEGVRVYGQQQVIPDNFSVGDYYIPPKKFRELQRHLVSENNMLVSVMGTIGRVAIVPKDAEKGIINPRLVKYRISEGQADPHFLKEVFHSNHIQDYFSLHSIGTTMDGLNMQIIGEAPISLPPLEEQNSILKFINESRDRMGSLITFSETQITLLQERRTALISAAVTGKIDVRDWEPEE